MGTKVNRSRYRRASRRHAQWQAYRQHFALSEYGLRIIIIISPELTRQEYILIPIFLTDRGNQL